VSDVISFSLIFVFYTISSSPFLSLFSLSNSELVDNSLSSIIETQPSSSTSGQLPLDSNMNGTSFLLALKAIVKWIDGKDIKTSRELDPSSSSSPSSAAASSSSSFDIFDFSRLMNVLSGSIDESKPKSTSKNSKKQSSFVYSGMIFHVFGDNLQVSLLLFSFLFTLSLFHSSCISFLLIIRCPFLRHLIL
jgi:hypothetical protein